MPQINHKTKLPDRHERKCLGKSQQKNQWTEEYQKNHYKYLLGPQARFGVRILVEGGLHAVGIH